jgi:hypothetical protein
MSYKRFCVCLRMSNTYYVVFLFVFCALCCQILWIIHFWFPLRYSLMLFLCNFLAAKRQFRNWKNKNITTFISWKSSYHSYLVLIDMDIGFDRYRWPNMEWVLVKLLKAQTHPQICSARLRVADKGAWSVLRFHHAKELFCKFGKGVDTL